MKKINFKYFYCIVGVFINLMFKLNLYMLLSKRKKEKNNKNHLIFVNCFFVADI